MVVEIAFIGRLLAVCHPSGYRLLVASGVVGVVGVCNRSQMRTTECTFNFRCEYRYWPWL